jgi:zinc transport system substrate-binding protein
MSRISIPFCLAVLLGILGIGLKPVSASQLMVFVSIAPQKYFVQQIGKNLVDVQVLVPPGASPATYEPKPSQMAALARADAYVSIGVPFEHAWLDKIAKTNPRMQMVAGDQGIQKLAMASHHPEPGQHAGPALDPHIWTSPPLVMVQARTILTALQTLDPTHAQIFERNHQTFQKALVNLDSELHKIFDHRQGLQFMVFHPSWGYFAHTYGLVQVPVEIEGKAPKSAQLKKLIEHAQLKEIKVIFVQPQFSAKSAGLIAKAIGAKVIPADPLALDWAANLRRQAVQINDVLR